MWPPGYDCPEGARQLRLRPPDEPLGERLEAQGLVVRELRRAGSGSRSGGPRENDVLLAALGAAVEPAPGRDALVVRTSTETALRLSLDLDGTGRARVATGIGFLDHLLTLLAFHGRLRPRAVAGGDLDVDEHHTVEDVLAALGDALELALGEREGVARYGSATVPMDEAQRDRRRRPRPPAARGDRARVRASASAARAVAARARARAVRDQAASRCTSTRAGADDHHVAEAAFKALGRALGRPARGSGDGVARRRGSA